MRAIKEGPQMEDENVRSFDTLDELFNWLNERKATDSTTLHPSQRDITLGSHVVTFAHDLLIFGRIYTADELLDSETDAGATQREASDVLAMTVERERDGVVYGRFYSTVVPDGELGSNHKFNLWPISVYLFNAARIAAWNVFDISGEAERELDAAMNSFALHLANVTGAK